MSWRLRCRVFSGPTVLGSTQRWPLRSPASTPSPPTRTRLLTACQKDRMSFLELASLGWASNWALWRDECLQTWHRWRWWCPLWWYDDYFGSTTTVDSGEGEETGIGVSLPPKVLNFNGRPKPIVTPTLFSIWTKIWASGHSFIHSFCQEMCKNLVLRRLHYAVCWFHQGGADWRDRGLGADSDHASNSAEQPSPHRGRWSVPTPERVKLSTVR